MFLIAVIGFSPDNLELQEGIEEQREVKVKLLTSAEPLESGVQNSQVDVNVNLIHTASTASLGRLH